MDAITTLLLPAHRISYNKAAGAEAKERHLRSYVLGLLQVRAQRGDRRLTAGRAAGSPIFLGHSGVFNNAGYDSTVTLAQVFWFRDAPSASPPASSWTADRELTIAGDFADFGADIAELKRKLRKQDVRVDDHFPPMARIPPTTRHRL